MLDFLVDLPLWVAGPVIVALLCLYAYCGLRWVRARILPKLRITTSDSEFAGALVQCVMVFYGLSVALIAVQVFETHADTQKLVSGEATALAMLYRDVSSYPEPTRARLQGQVRDYTRYTIDEAWPEQRRGRVPIAGVELVDHLQATLTAFEPVSEGQKVVHAETLRAYNEMIHARRLRLDAVETGIPAVMWVVIVVGALIGIGSSFFFRVEDARLHAILVLMLALFIALVFTMILALDRPFRGDLALKPAPYELIYEHLMTDAVVK